MVREDPVQRGLLYAGTETGMYVSFNDGDTWQSLQLNLPNTPITDLKAQGNDLVAATQGRAFWILDDLSPLRQINADTAAADFHLFQPATAYQIAQGGASRGAPSDGQNPPSGAVIDFYVAEENGTDVALEILDMDGSPIRVWKQAADEDSDGNDNAGQDADDDSESLEVKTGMNRFVWDLRHESVTSVPGLFALGTLQGRRVLPGQYQARLTVGEGAIAQSFEVLSDPRLDTGATAAHEREEFLVAIEATVTELHESVIQIEETKAQIEGLLERLGDREGSDTIREAGQALLERLTEIDEMLVQRRWTTGQDPTVFPMRLNEFFMYLRAAVDNSENTPTAGARRQERRLGDEWAQYKSELDVLWREELPEFNRLVTENAVPAVILRR